jgi:hypothetical protein
MRRIKVVWWFSILIICLFGLLWFTLPAFAENWVLLQSTESPLGDGKQKLWGFSQMEYQQTDGAGISAGPWQGQSMVSNLIGPDLESSSTFNIKRARLGARGTIPGFDHYNYLIGIEAGNNAATKCGDGVELLDASITANSLPWLRFRIGQFKYPGSEEGMTPPVESHYIDETSLASQLLNESLTQTASCNLLVNEKAKGWKLDAGLRIIHRLWVNCRYDQLCRGTRQSVNERKFETVTPGLEYLLNPKIRLMANYALRQAEAPNLPDSSVANQNPDKLSNKILAQIQVVFP